MRRASLLAVALLSAAGASAQTDTARPPTPAGPNPGPVLDSQRALPTDVGRAGLSDPTRESAANRPNGIVSPPSSISSGVQIIAPERK